MLVTLAEICKFRLWTQDISQAYLQTEGDLKRDVYVNFPVEFQLGPNEILKLTNPLYGLTDSGDYWYHILNRHLREDLKMSPTTGFLSLFFKRTNGRLRGIIGSYVHDTLATGNEEFEEESGFTERKFKSSPRKYEDITFSGIQIT